MAASEMQLFQTLKNKLGERETEDLLIFVKEKITENNKARHENYLRVLATKEDLFLLKEDLKGDISIVRGDLGTLRNDVGILRGELGILRNDLGTLRDELGILRNDLDMLRGDVGTLRGDLGTLKGGLELKIAETKTDIIRWVFAFFVTLMLAIIGLYFKR